MTGTLTLLLSSALVSLYGHRPHRDKLGYGLGHRSLSGRGLGLLRLEDLPASLNSSVKTSS